MYFVSMQSYVHVKTVTSRDVVRRLISENIAH